MAVAKSYENMEMIGEPFMEDGKMFVKLFGNCPRCGGSGHYSYNQIDGSKCYGCMGSGKKTITVRWYTDAERARMDRAAEKRAEAKAAKAEEKRIKFAARNVFGFGEAGYITLYKGNSEEISEFFKSFTIDEEGHRAAWFNTIFKWFTPSKMEVPEELPEGIEPVRLDWDEVRDPEDAENLTMKSEDFVTTYVNALITVPSVSEYQGTVGAWMVKEVTIKRNMKFDTRYGSNHMHIMEDANKNVYVWNSSSKDLAEGKTVTMRMKVKEHKEYNGVKQTVVWYCRLV